MADVSDADCAKLVSEGHLSIVQGKVLQKGQGAADWQRQLHTTGSWK